MNHRFPAILFDIGGVLVALDGVPTMAKLLGVTPQHDALHAMWCASPAVLAHETGKMDAVSFSVELVAELELPVTPEDFLQDFCNWPTGLLPGALELLNEIPDSCHVAALSNTSAVHWARIETMGIVERFDQTYLSHQIGCMKPAPESFLVALEGIGRPPSEILFLDDSSRNVEAATALGMYAYLVKSPMDAREILVQHGVVSPARSPDEGRRPESGACL